jgi:1,4-alpha-glucan branching enzyme
MYADLVRLRRNWRNDTRGLRGQHVNVFHVNDRDKVIAFHRFDHGGPGDDVVVVLNFANRAYDSYRIGFPRGGPWRVRFNSDWRGYSDDFGDHLGYDTVAHDGPRDGFGFSGNVGVGPYSALILT